MLQLPDDPFVTVELAHDPARPVTGAGGVNHLAIKTTTYTPPSPAWQPTALTIPGHRRLCSFLCTQAVSNGEPLDRLAVDSGEGDGLFIQG